MNAVPAGTRSRHDGERPRGPAQLVPLHQQVDQCQQRRGGKAHAGEVDPGAVLGARLAHERPLASHLIFVVINAFALEDIAPGTVTGTPPDEFSAMITGYVASLPAEQFPNLVAVAPAFAADDLDARFELLLDLFVDGLA
jgi:hypothetical protein